MPLNPSGAEKALAAELNRLHIKTQIIRAAALFVLYLGPQLALANSWTGWRALAAIASTAAQAALHQVWPALPLDAVLDILARHRPPAINPQTAGGGPVRVSRFTVPPSRTPEPTTPPIDDTPTEGPAAP